MILLVSGCAETSARKPDLNYRDVDYDKVVTSLRTSSRRARTKNLVGIELLEQGNLEGAERAFHEALVADRSYGPAHNNLGKLYLDQGDMYRAAKEFEEARRLSPECPQPLNNLGLIYYQVDRFDEAIGFFQQANGFCSGHPEYLGNLVRARVRRGDRSYDLREQMRELQLVENRADWKDWEAEQLHLERIGEPLMVHLTDGPTWDGSGHQVLEVAPGVVPGGELIPAERFPLADPLPVEAPASNASPAPTLAPAPTRILAPAPTPAQTFAPPAIPAPPAFSVPIADPVKGPVYGTPVLLSRFESLARLAVPVEGFDGAPVLAPIAHPLDVLPISLEGAN